MGGLLMWSTVFLIMFGKRKQEFTNQNIAYLRILSLMRVDLFLQIQTSLSFVMSEGGKYFSFFFHRVMTFHFS